jgi:hypothetical protein
MRIPRATFGPSRTVSDPDGRTWTVRVVHRLPQPGEAADEVEKSFQGLTELIRSRSFWLRLAVFVPIALVVWRYWHSLPGVRTEDNLLGHVFFLGLAVLSLVAAQGLRLLDATRPWIVASAENPPVRMVWRVWRASGRRSVREAVDEIAAGLERGDPRPTPSSASWIGYDQEERPGLLAEGGETGAGDPGA